MPRRRIEQLPPKIRREIAATGARATDTSLELPANLPYDQWFTVGGGLAEASSRLNWFIGDWLVYGQDMYGESKVVKAAERLGMSVVRVRQYEWVAKAIEPSRRRASLHYSHHRAVAGLPAEKQEEWLDLAEDKGWPTRELVGRVQGKPQETDHTKAQWLLLQLGSKLKLQIWVARDDKGKSWRGQRFEEIPGILKALPGSAMLAEADIIEHIDVLWLRNGHIQEAFEIEYSTPVYSGLLRMSDLLETVPNLTIGLYVVAPSIKSEKVTKEVNRPTFASSTINLPNKCRLITLEELENSFQSIEQWADLMAGDTHELLQRISTTCSERGSE